MQRGRSGLSEQRARRVNEGSPGTMQATPALTARTESGHEIVASQPRPSQCFDPRASRLSCRRAHLGPIKKSEPISIVKPEPPVAAGQGSGCHRSRSLSPSIDRPRPGCKSCCRSMIDPEHGDPPESRE